MAGTAAVVVTLARDDLDSQGRARAALARAASQAGLDTRRGLVGGKVQSAADSLADLPDGAEPATVTRALADARRRLGLDLLVLAGPDGRLEASSRSDPLLASGSPAPPDRRLVTGAERGRALLAEAPLRARDGTVRGVLHGGEWVDDALLAELAQPLGVRLTVVDADGDPVASSEAAPEDEGSFRSAGVLDGGDLRLLASLGRDEVAGLGEEVTRAVVLAGLIALLLVALAAALAASPYRRALRRLLVAARSAAAGEMVPRLPVRGPEEVRDLARSFNVLTARLSMRVDEGEQEREELRLALGRMSEAFAITHDLPAIVDILTESAVRATGSRSAMFFSLNTARRRLDVRATQGPDMPSGPVAMGEGVIGAAAERGETVVWPGDAAPAGGEPRTGGPAAALPLRSGGRILGVLAVFAGPEHPAFSEEDVETLELLVRQASSAVENVLLHEEVKRQSITDGLTGVWNRRQFEMRSAEEVRSATRFHDPFGMVMVDVDRFKLVNDNHGHQVGDAVLIELARRLTLAVREIDMVARYGGEEFCLLLPRADLEETHKVAMRVWEAVGSEPFVVEGLRLPITVSAGVACHPDHGSTVRDLVAAADLALYRAKQAGRNRVERATPVAPSSPDGAPAATGPVPEAAHETVREATQG